MCVLCTNKLAASSHVTSALLSQNIHYGEYIAMDTISVKPKSYLQRVERVEKLGEILFSNLVQLVLFL